LKILNAFFSIFTNAHLTARSTEAFDCLVVISQLSVGDVVEAVVNFSS